jgi:hypothetical protein
LTPLSVAAKKCLSLMMPPAARYLLIAAVSFLSNGCDSFYVKENCQRFIDEMLHLGETDVLTRMWRC